jgi:multiple sugar transport system permease protein
MPEWQSICCSGKNKELLKIRMKTKKKITGRLRTREIISGYAMIAPLMIGVLIFYIGAFFKNIYYSFTDKGNFGVPKLIGLQNYAGLFHDEMFFQALRNTFIYVLVCVPLVLVLAIAVAVLLNQKVRGIGFFRVAIFLPAVTLPAAIGLVWKWLMNYEFGLFNLMRSAFGKSSIAWLSDPKYVLLSVSIVFIWASVAYQVVVLLAGLQGIPECYMEAAEIDGANRFQQFTRITLPLLSPTIFFVLVTTVINVFQMFDFIYLMIPEGSTGAPASRSLVSYFFQQSFTIGHKGYGAAISVILFMIIFFVTLILMILQKKFVFYDD